MFSSLCQNQGTQVQHVYNFDPLPPQDAINYCYPAEER